MALTLRGTKGSALTHPELDANFTTLDSNDYSTYSTLSGLVNTVQSNLTTVAANVYNTYTVLTENTYSTYLTVESNIYDTYVTVSGLIDTVQDNVTAALSPTITLNRFDYIANANQTVFNGPDINSQTMFFDIATTQVYMNGLLLRNSNDYILTANSNTVTLSLGVAVDTEVTVTSLSIS